MKPTGMLLAHGAGSGPEHPELIAVAEAVAPLPCRRLTFPYRRIGGRRPPDRAPVLVATVCEEAAALADECGSIGAGLVLGGRSMGGRMCSLAVAEGLPARALVLIAYPLHPPGRPDRLRTEHFPALRLPCLFVSGTRDPFATPDELVAATAAIRGRVVHHFVDGAGHEFTAGKLGGAHVAEMSLVIRRFVRALR